MLGGDSLLSFAGLVHGVSSCIKFTAAVAVGVFGGVGEDGIAGIAHSVPFGVRCSNVGVGVGVAGVGGSGAVVALVPALSSFASDTILSQSISSGKFFPWCS